MTTLQSSQCFGCLEPFDTWDLTPDGYCDDCLNLSEWQYCQSCKTLLERSNLDEWDICTECRAEQEHVKELRSDYYRSVL